MTTLTSFTGKQNFDSGEIPITADGLVQVFVNGHVSYKGQVKILVKGADGQFHLFPQLRFRHNGIAQLQMTEGDAIRVLFEDCYSAGADVRLLPLNAGDSTGDTGGGDPLPAMPYVEPSDGTYLAGAAEPGVTIEVDVYGDGSVEYTTTADASGEWYMAIEPSLPDGTYISVVAKNAAGSSEAAGIQVVAGGGDNQLPAVPYVEPSDGTYVAGTAQPGVTIEVDVDWNGFVDYTTTADEYGEWYVQITPSLPDGTSISVVAVNAAGRSEEAWIQVVAGGVPDPVPYTSVQVWINLAEGNTAGRASVRSALLDAIDKADRFKADGPEVYLRIGTGPYDAYTTVPNVLSFPVLYILEGYDEGSPATIQPGNTDWSELETRFDNTTHSSQLSDRAGRVAFSDVFITDTPLSQAAVDRIAADIAASNATINPSISPLRTVYMIQVDTSDTTTSAVIDNTPVDGIPVIAGSDTDALTDAILAAIYPVEHFPGDGEYAGRYLFATYQGSPNVRTYDTLAMEQREDDTFLTIGGVANRVAMSPDGSTLAIALDSSPGVTLRDPLTGAALGGSSPSFGFAASDVAWSPDGSMLAVAVAVTETTHVLNTADWTTINSLATPGRGNLRLAWSPDGAFLAIGGDGSPGVTVFDTVSGSQVLDVPLAGELRAIPAFSRDGQYLACVGHTVATTLIYHTSDWSEVGGLNLGFEGATEHPYGAQDAVFTDDHLVIATDGAPYLTRYSTGDWGLTAGVATSPGGPATALALSRDGGTLAISASPGVGGGIVAFYDTDDWGRSTYDGVQAPSGASNLSI